MREMGSEIGWAKYKSLTFCEGKATTAPQRFDWLPIRTTLPGKLARVIWGNCSANLRLE